MFGKARFPKVITLPLEHSKLSLITSGKKRKSEVEFGHWRWMVVDRLHFGVADWAVLHSITGNSIHLLQ